MNLDVWYIDLRQGFRLLRKHPASSAVAIASLALGIGACVTMFSIVNAALLRTLPVREPDRLVFVFTGTAERPYGAFSFPAYLDFRDGNGAFEGLAAYASCF